ncbi:MAG: FAD-dependent oxidoreductase, partial [Bacilli bacterium]
MYDCIIIGSGVAGMSAAIYLKRASKKVLIIEKETIGGQISSSPLVENYPGFISISGSELANNMFEQVLNLGVEVLLEEVIKIEGKHKLNGRVRISGSKNATVALIPAAILANGPVTI